MDEKDSSQPQPVSSMQFFGGQRDLLGPSIVAQAVRQAVMHCWMMLPKDQKTPENVEAQLTRLMKRAIEDMKEDATAFGFTS
ncbi:MAG: hypothetical protein KJ069_14320 [Anaerolineae bacterium]|nr:hypothetical protein [Anaerolineae bacterium]